MHPGMIKEKICMKKIRFFHGKKCATGKTYETKCAAGQNFGLSPDGYSVLI